LPGIGAGGSGRGGALAAGVPAGAHPSAGHRPNIVFVLADDLTADLFPVMPHARAMQRAGVAFDRYIVSDSLCCPSRTSILTGRYPHSTGVWGNERPTGGYSAFVGDEQDHTFATRLHAAGYRTGLLGKYLNGYHVRRPPASSSAVPPGWDRWFVAGGSGYGQFDYTVNDDGTLRSFGHRPQDYGTDVLAREAARFVDDAAGARKPFLLEVSTFSPHLPAVPAPRYARAFARLPAPRGAAFDQAVRGAPQWLRRPGRLAAGQLARLDRLYRQRARAAAGVDDLLGAVQAALVRAGVADDTYLVFSSDNGFHLGQHRLLPGKRTAFDTDVRVPLLVTGPGVPAGVRVGALASNIDLAPTFLEIGRVPVPRRVEGRSLLGWWRGRPPAAWRDAVLVEYLAAELRPGDPDRQEAGAGRPARYLALRRAQDLWVAYEDGERERYDLRRDPLQQDNVAAGTSLAAQVGWEQQLAVLARCYDGPTCHAADSLPAVSGTTAGTARASLP
jgi:N-acetylglucosamine-6-sulfatase